MYELKNGAVILTAVTRSLPVYVYVVSVEPNGTTVTAERLTVIHPKTSEVLFSSDSVTDDILSKSHEIVSFGSLTTARVNFVFPLSYLACKYGRVNEYK